VALARRARVVLAHADGTSLAAIATRLGLHRDSCRRWLLRYRTRGTAGLLHGNAGKPKNVVFDAATCAEIRRRASAEPGTFGEPHARWSLYKLRDHLVRRHVVRTISVERLRQLLREGPTDREHWNQPVSRIPPLAPQVRRQLGEWARDSDRELALRAQVILAIAGGMTVAKAARTFRIGKNRIRRWVAEFELAGVTGLQHGARSLREAIVRLTSVPPHAAGARGDLWSLGQLRAVLQRHGVTKAMSLNELRRVAEAAGLTMADFPAGAQPGSAGMPLNATGSGEGEGG